MPGTPVYTLKLVNEKTRFYRKLNGLVILINIALYIYLALFAEIYEMRLTAIGGLIVLFLYYAVKYFFFRSRLLNEASLFSVYTIMYTGYLVMGWYWFAGIILILSILFILATLDLLVLVYPGHIRVAFRDYKWEAISNMMLKDGMLTIDLKNNKIIQELVEENEMAVDEKEFNEFCSQQLNS